MQTMQKLHLKLLFNRAIPVIVVVTATVLFTAYSWTIRSSIVDNLAVVKAVATDQNPQQAWRSADQIIKEGRIPPIGQILEINLSYDIDSQPALKIADAKRKTGYAPLYEIPKDAYKLEVLDSKDKVINSVPFIIPNQVEDPPPLEGEKKDHQALLLKKVDFTLTVEWTPSATKVRIVTPEGLEVASKGLTDIPVIQNKPNFKSLPGDKSHTSRPTSFIERFIPKASAQTTPNILDITFIGDDYLTASDLNTFHNDVNRFTAHLLTYESFKSRATQIMFHYVDNTADLGCTYSGRLIICDYAMVFQQINNFGAPYDKIVVIVNNSTYGGSGGSIAISYNGSLGPQVFVHEFGHSLGSLIDEYNLYTENGILDSVAHVNCYAGTPPASEWSNLVALADYTLGCKYPNWYRSFPGSIMINLDYQYFNAVSQVFLNNKIDYFAGPFTDTNLPVSTITSPVDGSVVSGTVTVTTSLTDDNGVARAELWKDSILFHSAYIAPFSFSWPTIQDTEGFHTLQVKAYDVAGNVGSSPLTTVTVQNTDTTPPSVSITNPANGSFVGRDNTITIRASASDTSGIAKVEFLVNNSLKCTDTTFSYSCKWRVPNTKNVVYTLTAKAFDTAGNIGSHSIQVTSR